MFGYKIQNKDKQNKKHNTKNYKDEKQRLHQKPGVNPGVHDR
jgi:hypothetical protein